MKKFIVAAAMAIAAITASQAQADLVIDVTGVAGSGVTTWTFSTTSAGVVSTAGSIRDVTNNTFSAFDTGQFPFGQDTILDTSIQNVVFALTGDVFITIGGNTEQLTGIFLDDDGGSADDLGVRALNQLDYLVGDTSSWTGSGTVNVDISAFALGTWSINSTDGQAMFFSDPITVNFSAIPEPTSLALVGVMAVGCVLRRRRKYARGLLK